MSFFDDADLDQQQAADKEAAESPKFDPAEGDVLDGVLTKAEAYSKGRFDPTIVINFRNVGKDTVGGVEPGKVGYLFLPTVLRRKFLDAAPAIGTAFRVRFEGTVAPEKGGNPYKDWTLITESMTDATKVDRPMWEGIRPAEVNAPRSGGSSGSEANTADDWMF